MNPFILCRVVLLQILDLLDVILKSSDFCFQLGKERISSIETKFGLINSQIGMERALNLLSEDLDSSLSSATSYRDAGQNI